MPEALTPRRKKLLVLPHTPSSGGGGSCVGAWVVQALADRHDVSVLTWEPTDVAVANQTFGTALSQDGCEWITTNPGVRWLLGLAPTPLTLLQHQLLYRQARRLWASGKYEAVIGAMNEIEIGTPVIQYIHFPWNYWPRPDDDLRWYHLGPLVAIYRKCASLVSGYRQERVVENLTLANSDWTGRVFERWYGAPARTVYPPVPGGFPDVAFEDRKAAFVCIGRISREKRIGDIIRILIELRGRGHEVSLRVIGHKGKR